MAAPVTCEHGTLGSSYSSYSSCGTEATDSGLSSSCNNPGVGWGSLRGQQPHARGGGGGGWGGGSWKGCSVTVNVDQWEERWGGEESI